MDENIKDFRDKFFDLVKDSKKILIASHRNPDHDSISSVLSMYYLLHSKFPEKEVEIMYASQFRNNWTYFANNEQIRQVETLDDHIDNFDTLIILDVKEFSRVSPTFEKLKAFSGKKICIDHHESGEEYYDLIYVDTKAHSVAELMYKIFFQTEEKLDKKLVEVLLLGILGDTAFLTLLKPWNYEVLNIVARLVKEGEIYLEELKSKFWTFPEKTFVIMQEEVIRNAKCYTFGNWPRVIVSYVSREYVDKTGYAPNEISEATFYFIETFGKTMTDVSWGIVVYPGPDGAAKVSLRSRPESVNVREFAETMAGGGGHNGSSGMSFKPENPGEIIEPEKALEKILEFMRNNDAEKFLRSDAKLS